MKEFFFYISVKKIDNVFHFQNVAFLPCDFYIIVI